MLPKRIKGQFIRRAWGLLALLACSLAAWAAVPAIDGTLAPRLDLSDKVEWCEAKPEQTVAGISTGGCRFAPARPTDLARGFSNKAFWLRLTLSNPGREPQVRWLRIGHPRLQEVSFFEAMAGGSWRRSNAGIGVPMASRPIISAYPILPIELAPGENRLILVRVVSETSVDLTPSLWDAHVYTATYHGLEVFQAMAIGCLLMAGMFALLIFARLGERTYLYFGATLLVECLVDAAYTGLLQMYLWPVDLGFDIRAHAIGSAVTLLLFIVFVRQFVGKHERFRTCHAALLICGGIMLLAVAWACLVNYGEAVRVLSLSIVGILLSATLLFLRAWRSGSRPAGYLLLSFTVPLLMLLYRIMVAFGGGNYADAQAMGYSWGFVLITPSILAGIASRRKEMDEALALARAENSAQVHFLAQMSHELRTPLNIILGNAQLLARPGGKSLLAEGVASIHKSATHLLGMIDEILDHARGLGGKLSIQPDALDVPSFLQGVARNARLLAATNHNAFSLEVDGDALQAADLDEGRLRQILDNLLANAARHTRNGRIRLAFVSEKQADGQWRLDFTVEDSGEGIPLADQERIFLPFERGNQNTRQGSKGTGMGLAISRQLVEAMGGQLSLDSRPGEGARFHFWIVAKAAAASPDAVAYEANAYWAYRGPRKEILLVEDDDASRKVLKVLLTECGFRVREAVSEQEARALLLSMREPDLIITDQFMAGGTGWQLLKTVERCCPDVPVVLMSAALTERPERFSARLDFAAHWLKPLDHRAILHDIGKLLQLEWTSAQPAGAYGETSRPALAFPGDDAARQVLREMIDGGRVTDIMDWGAALTKRDPACAQFVEALLQAARELDFPALNALAGVSAPLSTPGGA